MALEGVIFQHDRFYNYNGKEAYSNMYIEDEPSFYDLQASLSLFDYQTENFDSNFLQEDYYGNTTTTFLHQPPQEIVPNEENTTLNQNSSGSLNYDMSYDRAKGKNQATRRRSRAKKDEEEINNQRMTHIAVERNRRKLMNEHLSVLRSLMPESYVQRVSIFTIIIYTGISTFFFFLFLNHFKYRKF